MPSFFGDDAPFAEDILLKERSPFEFSANPTGCETRRPREIKRGELSNESAIINPLQRSLKTYFPWRFGIFDPRYTKPPIMAHSPDEWRYSKSGRRWLSGPEVVNALVPSKPFQPRLAPASVGLRTLISSRHCWPRSVSHKFPVARSNEKRKGFRTPVTHIRGSVSGVSKNGLPGAGW